MAKITKMAKMPSMSKPKNTHARVGSTAMAPVVKPGEIAGPSIDHVDTAAMAKPTNSAGAMGKRGNKCPTCGSKY